MILRRLHLICSPSLRLEGLEILGTALKSIEAWQIKSKSSNQLDRAKIIIWTMTMSLTLPILLLHTKPQPKLRKESVRHSWIFMMWSSLRSEISTIANRGQFVFKTRYNLFSRSEIPVLGPSLPTEFRKRPTHQ